MGTIVSYLNSMGGCFIKRHLLLIALLSDRNGALNFGLIVFEYVDLANNLDSFIVVLKNFYKLKLIYTVEKDFKRRIILNTIFEQFPQ